MRDFRGGLCGRSGGLIILWGSREMGSVWGVTFRGFGKVGTNRWMAVL